MKRLGYVGQGDATAHAAAVGHPYAKYPFPMSGDLQCAGDHALNRRAACQPEKRSVTVRSHPILSGGNSQSILLRPIQLLKISPIFTSDMKRPHKSNPGSPSGKAVVPTRGQTGSTYEALKKEFENPSSKYRPTAFWSLNGRLDVNEIERQVSDMHAHGMGGFVLHARLGLESNYMGAEWFAAVKKAVETAARLGMTVWLYDEFLCPSGRAYGEVYREGGDEYILKALSAETAGEGGIGNSRTDNIVAAFSTLVEEESLVSCERVADLETKSADLIVFRSLVTNRALSTGEIPNSDNMNPDAVNTFINKAYEPYKRELSRHFGKTILGIFTDEPSIATADDFEGIGGLLPWTDGLPEHFKRKRGYDILDNLPWLFFEGKQSFKIRHDYWHTVSELFSENYSQQIGKWCENAGVKFTGHYLNEKSFGYGIMQGGSIMPHYRFQHTPALDILCEQTKEHLTVKQCTSVAHQYGRDVVMSESYGCSGWTLTFEGMKWVGDWQYVMGVNLLTLHLYMYSIKGFRKLDHPPFFGQCACWWKYHETMQEYFARVGTVTSYGDPVRSVLVIHPLSSAWGMVAGALERSSMFDNPDVQRANDYGEEFNQFVRVLMGFHYDFDLGDETIIQETGAVEGKAFRVNKAEYDLVILPPMETLFSRTVDLLEKYLDSGGAVVAVQPVPVRIDGVSNQRLAGLFDHHNASIVADVHEACAAVGACLPRTLSVQDEYGNEAGDILAMERRLENVHTYLLVNTDRKRGRELTMRFEAIGKLERWNPLSGERTTVPVVKGETSVSCRETIGPAGSRLYVLDGNEKPDVLDCFGVNEKSMYGYRDIHAVLGPESRFSRTMPNTLVLDMCRYKLQDNEWSDEIEARRADIQIRDKLAIGQKLGYGINLETHRRFENNGPTLELEYRFEVETLPDEPIELVLEEAAQFKIILNGRQQPVEPKGVFLDPDFLRIPLHGLHTGGNTLSMTCRYTDSLEIESCFLIGDFAVNRNRSIVREPSVLRTGDWCLQGYPHYSGSIVYHFEANIVGPVDDGAFLEVGDFEGACVNVSVNGKEAGLVPWRDADGIDIAGLLEAGTNRIDIEVMGTPRNVFGPFHLAHTERPWTGEPSFFPSGPSYTHEYVLHPYGLMQQVNIYKSEFVYK